jgi:CelD/BcsL family acetyltransferase involved in cellulose biosynthesis
MAIDIHVVGDERGLDELQGPWRELLQSSASDRFFLTWEWLRTWWATCHGGRALFVVTVRAEGRLIGLAPFMLRRRTVVPWRPLPVVEFLGAGDAGSDYLDVIARRGAEEDVAQALAGFLGRQSIAFRLPRVPGGQTVVARMVRALGRHGWHHESQEVDVCPVIRLTGHTWSSYLQSLGREHRYNVGRRLRNLVKTHVVQFQQVSTEAMRREALGVLIALHNRRWKTRGGSTAFHTPALREFHDRVSALALERGWLRLFILRLDDAPVAALYGFAYGGRFYFYQSGFDEAKARLSVGLATMALAIERAIGEHLDEYDLLHGTEAYKSLWTRETHPLIRFDAYPPDAWGFAGRMSGTAGRFARLALRRIRPAPIG